MLKHRKFIVSCDNRMIAGSFYEVDDNEMVHPSSANKKTTTNKQKWIDSVSDKANPCEFNELRNKAIVTYARINLEINVE